MEQSGKTRLPVRLLLETLNLFELRRAFTGYIDIQARHLFFYFFESRSDPDKDDVIFWTNGGPGCSSSVGLFMELGVVVCKYLRSYIR